MNTKSFPQSRIHYSNYPCMMGPSVVSCSHSSVLTGRSKACLFFAFTSRTELMHDVPIASIAITVTKIYIQMAGYSIVLQRNHGVPSNVQSFRVLIDQTTPMMCLQTRLVLVRSLHNYFVYYFIRWICY